MSEPGCGHEGPCDHCVHVMWRSEGETHCPVCGDPHPDPAPDELPANGQESGRQPR